MLKKNTVGKNNILPFFSIITIVYNGDFYLEQAILSVVSQTFKNYEYIIIDGGSTDKTLDIIKKNEANIDYWISETDDGISDAFNKGIKIAQGKFIGIVNVDDWFEIDTLERVHAEITKKEKPIDILCGGVRMWEAGKKGIEVYSKIDTIKKESTIQHAASFISKKAYLAYGGYKVDYQYAMDYELFLRMYMQGANFSAYNSILANRRLEGVSYQNYYIAISEVKKAREDYFSGFNVLIVFYYSILKGSLGQAMKQNSFMKALYFVYWKFNNLFIFGIYFTL